MSEPKNQFSLEGIGTAIRVSTRSSPAHVMLWLYLIISFFSLLMREVVIWEIITVLFVFVFILLLLFKPDRLWSESHSFDMKMLDLKLLGDKKNPQVSQADYQQLFQPIVHEKKIGTKTRK